MIAIRKNKEINYPDSPPFHPKTRYPEYPFSDFFSEDENGAYCMVRQILFNLG